VYCYLLVGFGCWVKGCEILINSLSYYVKFREELEFKAHYGFALANSFSKKKKKKKRKRR